MITTVYLRYRYLSFTPDQFNSTGTAGSNVHMIPVLQGLKNTSSI